MSEVDFFPSTAGQFRGSKYPGFTGGSTDQFGNQQPVGAATNVSQSSGNNLAPEQVKQQQVDKGNTSAQTSATLGSPSSPSAIGQQNPPSTSIGGAIAQGVLPAVGDIAGSAGGAVLGSGGSLGDALGAGGEALASRGNAFLSGNFSSGLLGSSSGAATAAGASSLSSAGLSGGVQGINVGTAGVDQIGENAISDGIGASGASEGASLGGGALAGVGTFAADLLSGKNLKDSAFEGVGAGLGGIAGSYFGPIGTMVGSWLGSKLGGLVGGLFGNKTPTVGPNGDTLFTVDNGKLGLGITGADNGADPGVTENAAKSSITAINKVLDDNNLQIDTSKLSKFGDKYYNELSLNQGNVNNNNPRHSALDVWNNLMKANAIVSKTPGSPTAVNNVTTVTGNGAPVAGSVVTPGTNVKALTGALQP